MSPNTYSCKVGEKTKDFNIFPHDAHSKSNNKLSGRQIAALLEISTGGKIKYSTLVKWPKAKAIAQGGEGRSYPGGQ